MRGAHIDVSGVDREEGEELAKSIARKVLEASEREPATIEVMSVHLLREVAPESYDLLAETGDVGTEDGLEGTVEASDETVDTVLDLFHPTLIMAVIRDGDEQVIFARHEYAAMEFSLSEDSCEELEAELTESEAERVQRTE
jgi:hypothetical protein